MQRGTIAVQTENIFPIIKKFLYSDHEIFMRELVSNAVDATTKLRVLANSGQITEPIGDDRISISINEMDKTLTISDKGIGMTEEEVLKYLNQIAFSSATEFLEQHKESGIIGHFGLGFYSAFMVADRVDVVTKSFKPGSETVKWSCDGSPEYSLEKVAERDRGTDIILHISDENKEFLERNRVEMLLEKYCKFLPVPIQFGTRTEYVEDTETEVAEGEQPKDKEIEVEHFVNEQAPIWKKQPSELSPEDYRAFYRLLYPMSAEPEFWIHLNIDYPFNLTGVLYFPKVQGAFELQKNKIQLYSNQVFVTDNVSDIVPEWLTMLHGVIDSPDIPLNVSRSYLQADGNVKKITGYITKKVADKLAELYRADRKNFESKWKDLGIFIKFGSIQDEKFAERAAEFLLLKNTDGQFFTPEEYKTNVKDLQTDKHGKVVAIYANDKSTQDAQIKAAQARGFQVLEMSDAFLDNHFMQHLEYKAKTDLLFVRVDSETPDNLVQKDTKTESVLSEKEQESVKNLFKNIISTDLGAQIELKALAPDDQPVVITRPEFMRRMREMQQMQSSAFGEMPDSYQVVVNSNHPIVAKKLVEMTDETAKNDLANYLYQLALVNQGMLKGEKLTAFVGKTLAFLN
jgi:molecular chaperone HtpG